MTIKWNTNEDQTQSGIDGNGNKYKIGANQDTVTVNTPDGFTSCGWTAQDALSGAMAAKEAVCKSWTLSEIPKPITLTAPHDISSEDIQYWAARSITLLGTPVEVKEASRIYFNRHDWTGLLGIIYPTGPDTFTIKDVDGNWLMTRNEDVVVMTDIEKTREYHGFKSNEKYYFAEMGCEREDADPRIAFAQLMYNL